MGGGYNSDNAGQHTINDRKRAEKDVTERFAELKSGKPNIFISFDHDDEKKIDSFRDEAKKEGNDLEFSDYSIKKEINSKNKDYIKEQIIEQIKCCSVTVVYLSDETHKSEWVNWEIKESIRQGNGVIGVYQGNKAPDKLPTEFVSNGCKTVEWKQGELMEAIKKARENR